MSASSLWNDGGVNLRIPKAAELLTAHIRRRIVRGELREGDALPSEQALMQEFSVSRPTLREAFRILESEGLLTIRRGAKGGASVHVPKAAVAARYAGLVLQHRGTTLADVYAAHTVVEAPAARMVAGLDDEERRKAITMLRTSVENHRAELLNPSMTTGFHRLLVELAGNETLMLFTSMLEFIGEVAGAAYVTAEAREGVECKATTALHSHEQLIDLIEAGDAEEAERFWREHLEARGPAVLDAGDFTLELLA